MKSIVWYVYLLASHIHKNLLYYSNCRTLSLFNYYYWELLQYIYIYISAVISRMIFSIFRSWPPQLTFLTEGILIDPIFYLYKWHIQTRDNVQTYPSYIYLGGCLIVLNMKSILKTESFWNIPTYTRQDACISYAALHLYN